MDRQKFFAPAFFFLLVVITSAEAGSGFPFYGDPPDETHPWAVHDRNRPQPPKIDPGTQPSGAVVGTAPSDATLLFDGTEASLDRWISAKKEGGPALWKVLDGVLHCVPKTGDIRTRETFGDCQLHIEWSVPESSEGAGQRRGNSGVFLMGMTEVQVLDNYSNPSYPDGMAGSVYGVAPPLVNALRKTGQWQSYDIVFRRPLFKDGSQIDPGYYTVFVNGVLVQDHTPLEGGGGHRKRSKMRRFPDEGPLRLQDHGDAVRFRNIWIRPLPPRALDGGEIGLLSDDATSSRRVATAKMVREKAAGEGDPTGKMLLLFESLYYEDETSARDEALALADLYASGLEKIPASSVEEKKGEVLKVKGAFAYLVKHGFLQEGFAPLAKIQTMIDAQGWEEKK